MKFRIKDDDGYAALLFDDKAIIGTVRMRTLADKARAQLIVSAPELLQAVEIARDEVVSAAEAYQDKGLAELAGWLEHIIDKAIGGDR